MSSGIGIGVIYKQMGEFGKAQEIFDDLLERSKQEDHPSSYFLVMLHSARGETDEAFKWLDKAYEDHESWLCRIRILPYLEDIRSDPRYLALLKKMNLDK